MRGFLGGVSLGTLVAVGSAAMWSLSTPLPRQVSVSTAEPVKGDEPRSDVAAPIEAPTPDADLVEAAPTAPVSAPIDDLSEISALDTEPSARPEVGSAGEVESSGEVEIPDLPAAPSEQGAASGGREPAALPQRGPSEDSVQISTAPAPPPPVMSSRGPEASTADQAPGTAPEVASVLETPSAAPSPAIPGLTVPQLGSAPAPTAPPVITYSVPQPSIQPQDPEQDQNAADGAADRDADVTGQEDPVSDRIAALPTADAPNREPSPQIGTRVIPLTERGTDEDTQTEAGNSDAPSPFEAFSEPFDISDGRPVMSIILIDDESSVGAEALSEFPYPLSFAIDPEDPRALEKMTERRAAGFEVLILSDLPRDASPRDAETSLEVWFGKLPEVIGVLEGVDSGFQGNRPLADQVSDVMRAQGYGIVLQNSGLNTVQKLALREGVPAGVVFRDFDGAGQNPRAIRRFLDQAAFRAGQEGAVIMLGRLQPDTISALLLWGLQDRASRVALAPVSAGLRANLAGKTQ